jgi:NADH dehydrogenase (ubiquinone) Fe-S protein 5
MTEDPREDAPTAGQIRKLGLIEATMEEKNLKVSKWIPHKKEG